MTGPAGGAVGPGRAHRTDRPAARRHAGAQRPDPARQPGHHRHLDSPGPRDLIRQSSPDHRADHGSRCAPEAGLRTAQGNLETVTIGDLQAERVRAHRPELPAPGKGSGASARNFRLRRLLAPAAPPGRQSYGEDFEGMTRGPTSRDTLIETHHRLHADIDPRLNGDVAACLLSLHDAEPDVRLIGVRQAAELPAVRSKLISPQEPRQANPRKHQARRDAGSFGHDIRCPVRPGSRQHPRPGSRVRDTVAVRAGSGC